MVSRLFRFVLTALFLLPIFCGVARAQSSTLSWTGPGGVVWSWGLNMLPSRETKYVQALGSHSETQRMSDGVWVKLIGTGVPGEADSPIFSYSLDNKATWKSVRWNELGPNWAHYTCGYDIALVNPYAPQVFLDEYDGTGQNPFLVGTFSNGHFTWTTERSAWYSFNAAFDPEHANVVYATQVFHAIGSAPELSDEISLSDDLGNTWSVIPPPSQLEATSYFLVTGAEKETDGTKLFVHVGLEKDRYSSGFSNQNITNATVFVPNGVINNPSLMHPLVLSLMIGSTQFEVYNGRSLKTLKLDAMPVILRGTGRTFLPVRPVVEVLGGTISWDPKDKRVTIEQGSRTITLQIDDSIAKINGMAVPIDPQNAKVVPYMLPPGRTMLPLRFVAEALRAGVEYLGKGRIQLTYDQPPTSNYPWHQG